jgi:hypothetical protein
MGHGHEGRVAPAQVPVNCPLQSCLDGFTTPDKPSATAPATVVAATSWMEAGSLATTFLAVPIRGEPLKSSRGPRSEASLVQSCVLIRV